MRFLAFIILLQLCAPSVMATDGRMDGRMQIVAPSDVTAHASNKKPASPAEVQKLMQAMGAEAKLAAGLHDNTLLVRQTFNNLLRQVARDSGAKVKDNQIEVLSRQVAERQARLQAKIMQTALSDYVKRHQNTYSQAETLQLLAFMQSPLGQKFLAQETALWGNIRAEINAAFAKQAPQEVTRVFKEAGYIR